MRPLARSASNARSRRRSRLRATAEPKARLDRERRAATASSADRTRSCTTTTCCGSAYRHDGGVRTRRARGSGSSSRQASAALGAPVLEHGAPGAGAHPGAKAVLAGTTAVVGLERTLQRRPPRRPGHHDQAGWPGCADQARPGVRTAAHPDLARLGAPRPTWQPGPIRTRPTPGQAPTRDVVRPRRSRATVPPPDPAHSCPQLWTTVWTCLHAGRCVDEP